MQAIRIAFLRLNSIPTPKPAKARQGSARGLVSAVSSLYFLMHPEEPVDGEDRRLRAFVAHLAYAAPSLSAFPISGCSFERSPVSSGGVLPSGPLLGLDPYLSPRVHTA
jgi:hypothetical protein